MTGRTRTAITDREMADVSIDQLNLAFDIQDLTPGQKVVLLVLANRANKNFEAWPSIGSIVEQSCMSRSGVKKALRELVDRGLLFKKSRRNRANVYHLTLDPILSKRSPSRPVDNNRNGHLVTTDGHSLARQCASAWI